MASLRTYWPTTSARIWSRLLACPTPSSVGAAQNATVTKMTVSMAWLVAVEPTLRSQRWAPSVRSRSAWNASTSQFWLTTYAKSEPATMFDEDSSTVENSPWPTPENGAMGAWTVV